MHLLGPDGGPSILGDDGASITGAIGPSSNGALGPSEGIVGPSFGSRVVFGARVVLVVVGFG